MTNAYVQYPGYTVDIPDQLNHPFKVFATVLLGAEFDHPVEVLNNPASAELFEECDMCVHTAIGKEFAHDGKIGDAYNQWRRLSVYERITAIIEAAHRVDPLDITEMKSAGWRHNFK